MKRIVVATCGKLKNETNQLLFSNSHRRSFRAYAKSLGIEEGSGEAFSAERERGQRIFSEGESVFDGVVSYYYVFAIDAFENLFPFVESELNRMSKSDGKDRDLVYEENLKNILKSLSQNAYVSPSCGCSEDLDEILKARNLLGFYPSSDDCLSYLKRMMEHVIGESREIVDMKFNFIEND